MALARKSPLFLIFAPFREKNAGKALAFSQFLCYHTQLAHPCSAWNIAEPDTAVEETARKELIEKFNGIIAANGGEVVKVEEWGKRRLAYAIDYKTEGYYVYVAFNGASELPKELSRNLGINENVIRSQIVKLLEKKSSVKPRPVRVAPVSEETPAEAAPAEQA